MIIKKDKKNSIIIMFIVFIIIFYYMMRVTTLVSANNGNWSFEFFSTAFNELYKLGTPLDIQGKNLIISSGVSFFVLMAYETYRLQNKRNVQENTYGSAEWKTPKDIIKKRDKNFENNMILTQTELISRNMKISGMNRHVILLGRPRYTENLDIILNQICSMQIGNSIIVTDPKAELLRDCGYSLKQKGYTIKVLNLDDKATSNHYNPLVYIKELKTFDEMLENTSPHHKIQEDDVMTLINTLMANTKSENIENTSGDPFWGATCCSLKRTA